MSNEILRLKAALASPHGKTSYVHNLLSQNTALTEGIKGSDLIKSKLLHILQNFNDYLCKYFNDY